MKQRIVLVGDSDGPLRELRAMLDRFSVEELEVPTSRLALSVASDLPVDLIVLAHPLPDQRLDHFARRFARTEFETRTTRALVLARKSAVRKLARYANERLAIVSRDLPPDELEHAVADYLRRAPRLPGRLMVKAGLELGEARIRRVFQTRNLSETGMFLRTRERFPIGARLAFELTLEQDVKPVQGVAEVVRVARPGEASGPGVGVWFVKLDGEDRRRLGRFLGSRLNSAEAGAKAGVQ